ncbi:MAG: hypothetical protein LBM70_05110 [Victivallales bacterium]|jgi:type II secretory pathway component GspD/PulD (secretin)|nr:hypothetical protein [Victivallales bacterium]
MMKKYIFVALLGLLVTAVSAEDLNIDMTPRAIPGTPRQDNSASTKGYGDSTVQAQLKLEVKDSVDAIHFIRDNSDPFVLTKAYELKHAEPYAMRGYLLGAVRGRKVADSPVQVDALRYNDGSGILLVSAEDYRFKPDANGESIDQIVERLDQPKMGYTPGRPKFIYFPRANTAANLREMVRNIGAAGDDCEFTSGVDVLEVDGELNALVVGSPYWSWKHMSAMLLQYDKPMPEVRISYRLLEIYAENDDKIGVDFQSWKNNEGADFFSAGGRYRNNWASTFAGGVNGSGSSRTDFFNFNPKWNSKYLDFLTANGHARVLTHGVLLAKNRTRSTVQVNSGLFYDDTSVTIPSEKLNDKIPEGKDKIPGPGGEYEIQHGKEQNTKAKDGFRFELNINPVVTARSTTLDLAVVGVSLVGWNSDGTPRLSRSEFSTAVQIGNNGQEFVIGGIQKVSVVRSVAGLPILKDLPFLGWLFSTESESTKRSQLVLIAHAEYSHPTDVVNAEIKQNIGKIVEDIDAGLKSPVNNLGFEQLGLDVKTIE